MLRWSCPPPVLCPLLLNCMSYPMFRAKPALYALVPWHPPKNPPPPHQHLSPPDFSIKKQRTPMMFLLWNHFGSVTLHLLPARADLSAPTPSPRPFRGFTDVPVKFALIASGRNLIFASYPIFFCPFLRTLPCQWKCCFVFPWCKPFPPGMPSPCSPKGVSFVSDSTSLACPYRPFEGAYSPRSNRPVL